jgi:hypothetical protein
MLATIFMILLALWIVVVATSGTFGGFIGDFANPDCLDSVDEIHPEPKDRLLVTEELT